MRRGRDRGSVGGAFGSGGKRGGTGTRNLQTYKPQTEREAQVRQLLRQKSAELEKMREMLGPIANELVRHGLTPKEAENAMPYIKGRLSSDMRQYLGKNPEMFAKLAKSAAKVREYLHQDWKEESDRRAKWGELRAANAELDALENELRVKMREAKRGERKNAPDPRNPLDMLFNQGLGIRSTSGGYRNVIAAIKDEYPAVLKLTNPDEIREVIDLISEKVAFEHRIRGPFFDRTFHDVYAKNIEERHKKILKKLEIPA